METDLVHRGDPPQPLAPPGLRDLSQGLSWAAVGLLAAFLLAMGDSILPARLADPAWQVAIVIALVDSAPIPLVALAVLHTAAWMDPRNGFSAALRDGAARWAVIVALGFLLLVPLTSFNGWTLHAEAVRLEQRQQRQAEERFRLLRQAVDQAATPAELQQRLRQVVGPGLPPFDAATPLPELRRELRRILERNQRTLEQQLRRQRQRGRSPGGEGLLGSPLRAALACLIYAVAFAALARRRGQELSLLAGLLLAQPGPAPRQRGRRALGAPHPIGAEPPEDAPDSPGPALAADSHGPDPNPADRGPSAADRPSARRPDPEEADPHRHDPHHDDPHRHLIP